MRSPLSHKGENGSIAIIGGSKFQHGAPLFAALAAEASGVDLVFVWVPQIHVETAKNTSLNFQVHTFGSNASDEISPSDRDAIIRMLATMDSCVIGPGLSRWPTHLASIHELLEECPCPIVADASALQLSTLQALRGKAAVVTPHLGELERMTIAVDDVSKKAKEFGVTFLVKGPEDRIVSTNGTSKQSVGGNAGLTVGGTGDALAGLVCGLIAQKYEPADACALASTVIKRAGDALLCDKGHAYTTCDVIGQIPSILKDLLT